MCLLLMGRVGFDSEISVGNRSGLVLSCVGVSYKT